VSPLVTFTGVQERSGSFSIVPGCTNGLAKRVALKQDQDRA
jgi:hypothetical protein